MNSKAIFSGGYDASTQFVTLSLSLFSCFFLQTKVHTRSRYVYVGEALAAILSRSFLLSISLFRWVRGRGKTRRGNGDDGITLNEWDMGEELLFITHPCAGWAPRSMNLREEKMRRDGQDSTLSRSLLARELLDCSETAARGRSGSIIIGHHRSDMLIGAGKPEILCQCPSRRWCQQSAAVAAIIVVRG